MPRYEFVCANGHRFELTYPIGLAPAQGICPLDQETGQRVFSVPTLITSYPMSLSEAQEQVVRWREEAERSYRRPEHEEIMSRVRKQAEAKRRADTQGERVA